MNTAEFLTAADGGPRNGRGPVASFFDAGKAVFDLHIGREGAADEFLTGLPGGHNRATLSNYFALMAKLPRASGIFQDRKGLLNAYGPDLGAYIFAELDKFPIKYRAEISQVLIQKSAEFMKILNAESQESASASKSPPESVRTCVQTGGAALRARARRTEGSISAAAKPDMSILPVGMVRVEAAFLWNSSQDAKKPDRERAAATARLNDILKIYGNLNKRSS